LQCSYQQNLSIMLIMHVWSVIRQKL